MKRVLDFIFAFILLVFLFPCMLVISLLIKTSSKGPILFKQQRIGLNKTSFYMYKFRTMRTDTPNVATHLLHNPQQYITPIGRFLRKTSLDELPQLFNIIKGDMSFVGPRPALYNQYDLIEMRESYGIHSVRPGLTGWAQINGRDELEIPEKVQYDLYYYQNQSIFFDFEIVLKTFKKVAKKEGVHGV